MSSSQNPKPQFAAAYIRVSTDDQAELSPDSQLEEIRRYAQRENIQLLPGHIYLDAGISGKRAESRPEFMRMIATAKERDCPFSAILLWKYSRFARNQEESIFYKSILRSKCGVEVVSVSEPLIAGPFGLLMERIIEWMDEFYSIRLSQEVKRSMKINAQRGKLQAAPSFGYRVEDGMLVPSQEEAIHVQRIFDRFLEGRGLYGIAKELNAMGVRTHRGNPFETRTVEYILRNPVYRGMLRWNPTGRTQRDFDNENIIVAQGGHQPLVSEEVWNLAQRRLDQQKAQWVHRSRPSGELKGWISGLVRCAACGGGLVFSQPHYYKCNHYVRGCCTHSQHIHANLLEQAILSQLRSDAGDALPMSYRTLCAPAGGGQKLAQWEAVLRRCEHRLARLQNAYLAGVLRLEEFAAARREIAETMLQAKEKLENGTANSEAHTAAGDLQQALSLALETLQAPGSSLEDRNNAARSVMERCTFDKESALLTIVYRVVMEETPGLLQNASHVTATP